MTIKRSILPTLALALTFGSALMGQDVKAGDVDLTFKPRYGFTAGNIKDDLKMDQSLGLGVQASYALTSKSWFTAELVYTYYPGKQQDVTKYSGPIYVPGANGAVTSETGGPYYLALASSVDSRKNYMSGFSVRGGYAAELAKDWIWQAGISLDLLKYTQEVSGILKPLYGAAKTNTPGFYEGLAYTPHKASLGIGAFAGVKYMITKDFSLEANAVTMGYKTQNYVPFTYSGQAASVDSQNRHGFGLEVAFGLKF